MVGYPIWTGALALALLSAAGVVNAEPAEAPIDTAQSLMERMDRDMDGKISFEEYRNVMLRRFEASDLDADGILEGNEFPQQWLAGAEAQATTGKVSWSDFGASLQTVFDRFDSAHDGQLDALEIAALAAARQSQQEPTS
jgi:hypothetical protein